MQDVAREVVAQLRRSDRPSAFLLTAVGRRTFFSMVKKVQVTAPVLNGRVVILVSYFDEADSRHHAAPWRGVEYERREWEGAVSFLDGFIGCTLDDLSLYESSPSSPPPLLPTSGPPLCDWECHELPPETRRALLRGAVQALLGRTAPAVAPGGPVPPDDHFGVPSDN